LELIIIPFIAALAVFFGGRKQAAPLALLGSLITLAYTLTVLSGFNTDGQFHLITDFPWLNNGIRFRTGLDGIGMLLVLLTHVLIPVIVLLQWKRDEADNAGFFGLILLMQAALAGVFSALDGLVFYIFWELALIPVWFICARWGGENRHRITLKFFIYTFLGSVFMLASLLYLYFHTPDTHSFSWEALSAVNLSGNEAMWVGAGLLLAFFIKIPVFPFHTWQPDTYTVSPSSGTMLLSGIMLKMGLFGLVRWYLPMVPEAIAVQLPIAGTLALTRGLDCSRYLHAQRHRYARCHAADVQPRREYCRTVCLYRHHRKPRRYTRFGQTGWHCFSGTDFHHPLHARHTRNSSRAAHQWFPR